MLPKNFKILKNWPFRLGFFLLGVFLGLLVLAIGFFTLFELNYQTKIYPSVKVAGIPVGGKTVKEIETYFEAQNKAFNGLSFTFIFEDKVATLSGEQLKIGYDAKLLADQAYLIGRSGSVLTAIYQKFATTSLSPSYKFDSQVLENFLEKTAKDIDIAPQEALFQFSAGRVTAFKLSSIGRKIDREKARVDLAELISPPTSGTITLTVVPVEPRVKTEDANNLGIRELLGEGKSFFRGSIANRIFNLSLAAAKLNGLLIAPGETFSFNQAVGEISSATGYKQAYIIKEKRTVLDDGGGVCQVSTTLFRAALAAGLPIEERQAHAYRVAYYEQGGFGPGLDATVYAPRVDLKIKNDTPAHILIQTTTETKDSLLLFALYGTADGRQVTIGKPTVTDQVPPPPDLYQDDASLPKDQVKQVDFAAWGAKAAFDYKVERNGEVLQNRTFNSNFAPWQAVFLRGTEQ